MRRDMAMVALVATLLVGGWLMTGCLSIPTPEAPRATLANGTLEATYQAMDAAAAQTEVWAQSQVLVGTIRAADTAMAAEVTAQAFRAWQTSEAMAATDQAWAVTQAAAEVERQAQAASTATAAERAWVEKGWTATADVANATGTAAANAQGTQAASTATQAGYYVRATGDAASAMALATSQAAQAQLAVQAAEKDRLDLEGKRLTNQALAWLKVVVPIFFALLLLATVVYLRRLEKRNMVIRRDERGLASVLVMNGQVVDPDRMLWPWLDPANPALAPAELQARITENAQKVLALAQVKPGKHGTAVKAMKVDAAPPIPPAPFPEGQGENAALPLAADWGVFVGHVGPELPLGVDAQGRVMVIDPERQPHRTVAGRSGGGKTRFGVRPAIAAALARGWYVMTLGETAPVGFHVFRDQPNYVDVVVDDPRLALGYLGRILDEVKLRMGTLYAQGASRWGDVRLAGPRVLVVIDEYAALADALDGAQRLAFYRETANISRLARKAGVHLLLGVQNPTSDSIRPSVRRNTLTQTFQVSDAAASRAIIEVDGAQNLQGAQYLAVLENGITQGVAFSPSDDDLAAYLAALSGRVEVWDAPAFVGEMLESPTPGPFLKEGENEVREMAERVREMWMGGASKSAMARALGLGTGGSDWAKVVRVVEWLESSSTAG